LDVVSNAVAVVGGIWKIINKYQRDSLPMNAALQEPMIEHSFFELNI